MAIIFISHRLDEVIRISDRIVVLRDGAKVADLAVDGTITERADHLPHGRSRPADPIADASLPPGRGR